MEEKEEMKERKEMKGRNGELLKGFLGATIAAIVIASVVAISPSGTNSLVGDGPEDIIINEIMYYPNDAWGGKYNEWIELYNNGTEAANITGWTIDEKSIPEAVMQPGDYLIIAKNDTKFKEFYPSVTCTVIKVAISLKDSGDTIVLKNGTVEVDNVTYDPSWGADGNGKTLELNTTGDWLQSFAVGGTPGARNSVLPPESHVDAISPYWQTSTPFTITATIDENSNTIQNVTLWYRNSTDNSTWGGLTPFGVDDEAPWEWSFTAPNGDGYYQFYSIATDEAGNVENSPTSPDAICGVDITKPKSNVGAISPYWRASTPFNITATASNNIGIKNVSLYYRYSIDNSSWGSWTPFAVDTEAPWNWSFTGSDGYYQFYSIATDIAGNVEDPPENADAIAGIDTTPPAIEIIYPIGGENISGIVTIKWNATDNIANLNGTIWIQYRNDTIWNEIASNLNNTGEYDWNTTTVSDGSYLIMVNATDYAGNAGSNESSNFTIDNTQPTIRIERPRGYLYIFDREIIPLLFGKTIIIGKITIVVNATDALSGIDRVVFFIDGKWKHNDTTSPYSWTWDETAFFRHSIKVVAYDKAGNSAMDEVKVKIFNF